MKTYFFALLTVLFVFSPLCIFASDNDSLLVERVREGDVSALRALLDESYRQKKDFPRAFYYLSLYHKATGCSFFEDDAKAFDEFGGLFKNAIESVNLLDKQIKEYAKELNAQEETITSQNKKYKALLTERDNLLSEIMSLDEELSLLKSQQDEMNKMKADLDEYAKELNAQEETITSQNKKYKALLTERNILLSEVDALTEEVDALTEELVRMEEKYQGLNSTRINTGSPAMVGVSRGLLTMAMSPLNLLRAPSYAYELTQSDPNYNPNDKFSTYCETTILLAPALVVETIPCVVDVANGLLDIITLGSYGDKIYGSKNSPWWWERTNRTFPWINKD